MAARSSSNVWLIVISSLIFACSERGMCVSAEPARQIFLTGAYRSGGTSHWIEVGPKDSLGEKLLSSHIKRDGLEAVIFVQHDLTESDVNALRSLPHLRRVSVCGDKTTDVSILRVARLADLTEISFYATKMSDEAIKHLYAMNKLEKLNVSDGWKALSDDGLTDLAKLTELRELRLSGDLIGDKALLSVGKLSRLRVLDIYAGRMTDAGIAHLRALNALEDLELRGPAITGSGLSNLSEVKTLKKLAISGVGLTVPGMAHLQDLHHLEACRLAGDAISNDMPQYLEGMKSLRSLELYCDNVGDAGLEHLRGLINLESLDLTGRKITGAGLEHLKQLTSLRRLSLDGASVSESAVKRLQKALPKCEVKVYRSVPSTGTAAKPPIEDLLTGNPHDVDAMSRLFKDVPNTPTTTPIGKASTKPAAK